MGQQRTLWLFGDTWVGDGKERKRAGSTFVNNTIGIMRGLDPEKASMHFHWGWKDGKPAAFFPGRGKVWLWPGAGLRLGESVLLTFMKVRKTDAQDVMGFETFGWEAKQVVNPDVEPRAWMVRDLEGFTGPPGAICAPGGMVEADNYVYFFCPSEPKKDLYLARVAAPAAERGDLTGAEWFLGEGTWGTEPVKKAAVLFSDAQIEASVHFDVTRKLFVMTHTQGFGAADIVQRTAPAPEGPWSEPVKLFSATPRHKTRQFFYAAKAHPHLKGKPLTFNSNSFSFEELVWDLSIYFPRFLRKR